MAEHMKARIVESAHSSVLNYVSFQRSFADKSYNLLCRLHFLCSHIKDAFASLSTGKKFWFKDSRGKGREKIKAFGLKGRSFGKEWMDYHNFSYLELFSFLP